MCPFSRKFSPVEANYGVAVGSQGSQFRSSRYSLHHSSNKKLILVALSCPMVVPAAYSGEVSECQGFLMQCQLYFEMLPHQFSGDRAKIAFIISLLSGKSRRCAESMWTIESPVMQSIDPFLVHFKDVFGMSTSALSVHDELFSLRQANRAIHDNALHFHTLAASSSWNKVALLSAYRHGLNPKIRQQMVICDDSMGLEMFMLKAQHISQHLFEEGTPSDTSSSCSSPVPEPMKTDQYRLSANERQRHLHQRLCLYCGENDHLLQTCSARPPRPTANLPGEYQDYQDVFSQTAATKLLPHRPWDCAIDLLPGAKLPKGRVYPLSILENKAMEEFIREALQQGFIQPSTSLVASSFFFVAKKDGGLRPCIDYRVLNSQTVKFAYPLPLVPMALEELRGAHILSKLDLRSAYNLIRIRRGDEWKRPS
ncbi:hypothetical protein QTP70_022658 [Hemibagrus guttatus]|uniref:DUF4939 domain-containing protein n=1 Tax=Hemibagrus guttatus TaxID=175788 RepID=A0AAE0V8R6_9TELE|nr:hypothetical protein QTP70_022658 [Hemibagrus guttatus]